MEKMSGKIKSLIDNWCDESEFRSPYLTDVLMKDVLDPFKEEKILACRCSFDLEYASEIQVTWTSTN